LELRREAQTKAAFRQDADPIDDSPDTIRLGHLQTLGRV